EAADAARAVPPTALGARRRELPGGRPARPAADEPAAALRVRRRRAGPGADGTGPAARVPGPRRRLRAPRHGRRGTGVDRVLGALVTQRGTGRDSGGGARLAARRRGRGVGPDTHR